MAERPTYPVRVEREGTLWVATVEGLPVRTRKRTVVPSKEVMSALSTEGPGHAALLASTGVVTALPLVCFGAAAIRVPLSTLGLLQYLAPVFQFLLGVLYFGEAMPPERWAGFGLVWLALVLLTADAWRFARRPKRHVEVTEASMATPAPADA